MAILGGNDKKPKGKGYLRLGDLLISAGLITQEQLEEGLRLQKGTGKRLGTVLQENGFITESELIEALQMQLGIEFIDLSKVTIPTELVQTVPKAIAKQYQVVPVRLSSTAASPLLRTSSARISMPTSRHCSITRTIFP